MPDEEPLCQGFDDAICIWMALITERERLQHIVETKCRWEPLFGEKSRAVKRLSDEELAEVTHALERLKVMIALAFDRREQLGAVFV